MQIILLSGGSGTRLWPLSNNARSKQFLKVLRDSSGKPQSMVPVSYTHLPAVSLLVPVYNVEKYLSRCLESARDQTLENIEVICINDGSTDRSPEIIREFVEADARFRSVDKENSGYGASMNMGLRAARGKYVGILESDRCV